LDKINPVGYKNSIQMDFHAHMRINKHSVDVFGLVRPDTPLLNTGGDGKHRSFVSMEKDLEILLLRQPVSI
jgi:hypothetical protein